MVVVLSVAAAAAAAAAATSPPPPHPPPPSLGSFSVSAVLLLALLAEYSAELAAKKGKLDTDPHLWMPMTLPKAAYVELMGQKGVDAAEAEAHHDRTAAMLKANALESADVLAAVDVGDAAYWWDYGQLRLYAKFVLGATGADGDAEAAMMRRFYGIGPDRGLGASAVDAAAVAVSGGACVCASALGAGAVDGSVLMNVCALDVQATGAVLVNVTARKIRAAKGAVLYNVIDDSEEGIDLGPGDVRVGVFDADGAAYIMNSNQDDHDGGQVWKTAVMGNPHSFEAVYKANADADISAIDAAARAKHEAAREGLGLKIPA